MQYFGTVEPQRRLAPHAHFAIRGTISRTMSGRSRRHLSPGVVASHRGQVPRRQRGCRSGTRVRGRYLDPETGAVLPTWDDALDAIDDDDQPLHVVRFGARFDARRARRIQGRRPLHGYLTKYLTKRLGDCHHPTPTPRARARGTARRHAALTEPCSPTLRELAPLLHPAQEPPARDSRPAPARARPTGRAPRLRRPARPGLPQVVRQDARRPPGRPPGLADPRRSVVLATDPSPLQPGIKSPRRRGLPVIRPAGSCASSPIGLQWENALAEARRRAQEALAPPKSRQPGGQHDEPARPCRSVLLTVEAGGRSDEHVPAVHPPPDRRTPHRVREGRPSRPDQRTRAHAAFIDAGRVQPLTFPACTRPQIHGVA